MTNSRKCGISVDIGTTNITIQISRLDNPEPLEELIIRNPQRDYGEEIISRIDFARKPENASKLTSLVRESVDGGVVKILKKSGYEPDSVDSVVVVGNTVMHHLFFGLSTASLLIHPTTQNTRTQSPSRLLMLVFISTRRLTAIHHPSLSRSLVQMP